MQTQIKVKKKEKLAALLLCSSKSHCGWPFSSTLSNIR